MFYCQKKNIFLTKIKKNLKLIKIVKMLINLFFFINFAENHFKWRKKNREIESMIYLQKL